MYYICKRKSDGFIFEAIEKAKGVRNKLGLDLFRYNGRVYEGRTGLSFANESDIPSLAAVIEKFGGMSKLEEIIAEQLSKIGESPRYIRPDERKQDIFPPDPAKANIVYGKDSYGKRHYFYRIEYEGYELFTLNKQADFFRQVYVACEGYMLGIGQHHKLEDIKQWLDGLTNGVKSEVERLFNESLANPQRWVDYGFANILGRVDEANAHNAPIRAANEREAQRLNEERAAKRIAEKQAEKLAYEQAIQRAEEKIVKRENVVNTPMPNGKHLIMQLFREHDIAVPLKTQGWINSALHSIKYDAKNERWSYQYFKSSKDSTVFSDYLQRLAAAIQTKQQFDEINEGPCPLGGDIENDCDGCTYSGDYYYKDGECVLRDEDNEDDMEL
ncbi:MAG: hypothetical protein FWB87_09845 [Defluviitaleaceae bacterium]|nr:hypothetical protein [Defluviitaleaceae bacterium]